MQFDSAIMTTSKARKAAGTKSGKPARKGSSLRHKTPITTRTSHLDAISSTSAQEESSQSCAVSQHSEAALSISSSVNVGGGNTTMAVLVAHNSLLEMQTCSYSHVGPSMKDMEVCVGWVYHQHLD